MPSSIKGFASGLSALVVLVGGCADSGRGGDSVAPDFGLEADELSIYGGSAPYLPEHDATVSLHIDYGWTYSTPFCSGTFSFDRWILSAAHCVDGLTWNDLVIHFGVNGNGNLSQDLYQVDRITQHNQWNYWTLANDISASRITTTPNYTDPVMPLPYSQRLTSADGGDDINAAGFGEQESGFSGVLEQVFVPLVSIGSKTYGLNQRSGEGICFGDSGGPDYIHRGACTYNAGAHSYVTNSNCRDYGFSTALYGFESWIESTTGLPVEECGGGGGGVDVVYTGTLDYAGDRQPHKYTTTTTGTHYLTMSATPSTVDFDLYLLKYTGFGPYNGWDIVASSTTFFTSNESITYVNGTAADYAVGIASIDGAGTYTVNVNHPV